MNSIACGYCGAQFSPRWTGNNFCSRKCSNTYHRGDRAPNPAKSRKCKKCGAKYSNSKGYRSEAFCVSCRETLSPEAFKLLTLEQIRSKAKYQWNAQVRRFNRQWNKEMLELPCASCGYKLYVELCHKKPISKFPKTTTLGEINHPLNVVQLCPTHHWEFDHGFLTL